MTRASSTDRRQRETTTYQAAHIKERPQRIEKAMAATVTSTATTNHWLVGVARRAGLKGADTLVLPPNASSKEAWEAVARAAGVTVEDLASRVGEVLRVPLADMARMQPHACKLVPAQLARTHSVFPIREDDRSIVIATSDPTKVQVEEAVRFASGRWVMLTLAPPAVIEAAIRAHYDNGGVLDQSNSLRALTESEIAEAVRVVEELEPEQLSRQDVEATPVVKLTNAILRDAVLAGASDIHIEPVGHKDGTVRFRIDGVLRQQMTLPRAALNRIVTRIKVLGKLDIADHLRPLDGRARIDVEGRMVDLRISTIPTRGAEKAVIRLLRSEGATSLEAIALQQHELVRLRQLIGHRDGIVLVTGPTGSGKTTTLYAAIHEIATGHVNIMTVEDPVEYELPGVTQMQVEPKQGVTFASALRAILRQDPDVIFIGEIRDSETAGIAVQAAMTGHLVLATLHTNDAVGAVARLLDLGLDRPSIAATVRGALAQRLIRQVCPDCVQPVKEPLTDQERAFTTQFGVQPTVRAVGCPKCSGTGYRGRLPVDEVALFTPQLCEQIVKNASSAVLSRTAIAGGMRTLRDAALERVRHGQTTLQEVERVMGETVDEEIREMASKQTRLEISDGGKAEEGPVRVLVVDDDPMFRELARILLVDQDIEVSVASDGTDAWRSIRDNSRLDLILTDLDMPGMDGEGLLNKIKGDDEVAHIPVMVLTASSSSEAEIRLLEAGADDYIRKPIEPARFTARVRAALRRIGRL
jgi:type IV pilus assembly protein PilB